ncbi:MAG TPA: hypothetical protein VJ201_07165 [Candidatus Babeliales bacterium]|nr:hypothetical protein [Candidatus Babeliales bacterium]HLC06801.1 hypothetical protein [Candidatus Babeliales bacterium]
MKKTVKYNFFILIALFNVPLYAQANADMTNNFEQRDRIAKAFVMQKLAEGTFAGDIQDQLIEQTPEYAIKKQAFKQHHEAEVQRDKCTREHCKTLYEEYKKSGRSGSWKRLRECEEQCATAECQILQKEVDRLGLEFHKVASALYHTPEGKLSKELSLLVANQIQIGSLNKEICDKQQAVRPLKKEREELQEEREKLMDELKEKIFQ